MSRYIDADAFKRNNADLLHCDFPYLCEDTLEEIIDAMQTADVVEVVRCKDCVYWEQATDNSGNCNRAFEITAYLNDFCSYGERREDDGIH